MSSLWSCTHPVDGIGYVFLDPKIGERFKPGRLTPLWDTRVRRKAGFESNCRFHDLRHTFSSHLVLKGINVPTVKDLMGHASITQTMIYSRLAPDQTENAIKILGNAFEKDTEKDTARIG